ncbi:MAG: DNA cytosine methyltransferase, partial [Candidatus Electrothrix sp. ATG2]|nr:DNA cytosine methyltransferase [Candidatus Electrothrix sp. ATG2]
MKNNRKINFLDLFAGAGGLSEGFIQAGFSPVAHVEADQAACFTLRTRMAYHWLKAHDRVEQYHNYLHGNMSRSEFYGLVSDDYVNSVINVEISVDSLPELFRKTDELLDGTKLDLIVGGHPCQAYSIVGRSRDNNRMKGDKRNFLYLYYAEFLKRYRPSYFVFENVTGLLSAKDENGNLYFDNMRILFRDAGYETEFMTLAAEEYGVLQSRKSIILVGKKGKTSGFYPEPAKWNPGVKVQEVLTDLKSLRAGEGDIGAGRAEKYTGSYLHDAGIRDDDIHAVTLHQARPNTEQDLEIYRIVVDLWNKNKIRLNYNNLPERLKTHRHRKSFLDRFKVVAGDLDYSHTVVAHIAKDGHYYIHPDIEQNRSLTPREAARLQTFPDDYFFESAAG